MVLVGFFWDGQNILIFSQPNQQKLRNVRHNPSVTLALDGTGKLGDDVIVVEGTAELLPDTSLSMMRANPAIEAKYEGWLQLSQEAGSVTKDQDWEAIFRGYSQPIRVIPTRILVGGAMQSIVI